MPTYVITGASRGIGFEFVRQLSQHPDTIVIGLVRDKKSTDEKVSAEIGRKNIHMIQSDLTDHDSLKRAAHQTSVIANGSVDYLIANGAALSEATSHLNFGDLGKDYAVLEKDMRDSFETNVIGNLNLFNLFMPLIFQGNVKKVIAISSGMADIDLIAKYDIDNSGPYSVSKAALNAVVAKFSAQYRTQGVLFMSISPGVVDTGYTDRATEEQKKGFAKLGAKFAEYAPDFQGPITPEESVNHILSVIDNASVEKGDGGSFVSHFGTKQWL